MGYFNYFIKCFIRRFVYFIFKPKIAFTILLSFCIFLGLKYYGYCAEWTDQDISSVLDGFATITNNQGVIITQLGNIGVDVTDLQNSLNSIKGDISKIEENTGNTFDALSSVYKQIISLNNNIISLMNTVNSNHEELINQLKEDNEAVILKLNEITNILKGENNLEKIDFLTVNNLLMDNSVFTSSTSTDTVNYFEYDSNFSYKITFINTSSSRFTVRIGGTDNIPVAGGIYSSLTTSSVSPNSTYTYTIKNNLDFNYICFRSLTGRQFIVEKISSSTGLNNINDSINEQGQNINNSINSSDVSVDSSLPTSDTNDITLDGFNSIFNTLYSSFTGTSSDVILPIPFTNKSITINYQNVFGNFSFGVLSSIISGFWYFIICLFIVNDIKNKINSIKAGNIENVQTTNIKGDLL